MTYSLTVAGYTFDNPPEDYRKHLSLGNTPVPMFEKGLAQFYQSNQQEIQFEVSGQLSLNEQSDLDELAEIQRLAVDGGPVEVDFDPFFSGECIIEDDPFKQSDQTGDYRFIMTVNEIYTDSSAYPPHATPTTGNTFELGSFDFGYDPDTVEQNYEHQTNTVDRIQGVSQSVDTGGLVTKVTLDGNTDGGGLKALWDKARSNELSYLNAEFQQGWALISQLSIQNNENAPDYLKGLFDYSLDLFVVSDPEGGIGQVSSYIDHDVKNLGTYVSDEDAGDSDFSGLEFTVSSGTGSLNGDYVSWDTTTFTLTDNDTNYVYVEDDDGDGSGTVKYNNSGFPADSIHLYRVYTSGGLVAKIEDLRSLLIKDNDADAGDFSSYKENDRIYWTVATGTSPDDPNGKETTWPTVTNILDYSTTNYLFLEDPDSDGTGTISVNQSGYPSNSVHMWRIDTDGNSITAKHDDRPGDLTEDGSGDTSDSDLVFSEDMVIDDSAFSFARILALVDSFDLSDPTLPWLGMAYLSDSIADIDDSELLPALGFHTETLSFDVNDGGSATTSGTGTTTTTETNEWGTATDYDNATGEKKVVHEAYGDRLSDAVELGYPTGRADLTAYWSVDEASGASTITDVTGNGYDGANNGATLGVSGLLGTTAIDFGGNDEVTVPVDAGLQPDYVTVGCWVNPDSLSNNSFPRLIAHDSTQTDTVQAWHLLLNDSGHVGFRAKVGGTWYGDLSFATMSTGAWQFVGGIYDGSTVYGYKDGTEYSLASVSGTLDKNDDDIYIGNTASNWPYDGQMEDPFVFTASKRSLMKNELYNTVSSGYLKTGWKDFSGDVDLSTLQLENVVASLNNQSIDIYVESDTNDDGVADETSDVITLDGSGGPYSVTGLSTSTDTFRLWIDLSTTDKTTTPQFDSADLTGDVVSGTSADADQNSNTTWTIFGGKYDTSGNEYEGGGVVTKYEA